MSAERFTGGCQCGAVRFEVSVDPAQCIACNCSRCGRLGSVLSFAPASDFTQLSGEEVLTEYRFASHAIRHLFCSVCGIQSFSRGSMADGSPMVAVNVRCLDGVDVFALAPARFDGAAA